MKKIYGVIMNITEKFGRQLSELSKEKVVPQTEIAKQLQVSVSTYANWEQGRREPDLQHLLDLAKIFEIDMNTLFDIK